MMISDIKSFLLTNQTTSQTILKNTFWLGTGKIGGRLLRTILVIYAARILGPAERGVFSYATNLVAILAVLTNFGISAIFTRETAKNTTEIKNEILPTSFFLKLLISCPALYL